MQSNRCMVRADSQAEQSFEAEAALDICRPPYLQELWFLTAVLHTLVCHLALLQLSVVVFHTAVFL